MKCCPVDIMLSEFYQYIVAVSSIFIFFNFNNGKILICLINHKYFKNSCTIEYRGVLINICLVKVAMVF